jgi:dTDP-4-dehydrorhamnose 3,5-epimerase-like enzyme
MPNAIRHLIFPLKKAPTSELVIFSSPEDVPFPIRRVFVIKAKESVNRGAHAHKACTQLLICLQGRCVVTLDDGEKRERVTLDQPHKGLLIPPGIWAEQAYAAQSLLMVFADQPYDEADYIRDYEAFRTWTSTRNTPP